MARSELLWEVKSDQIRADLRAGKRGDGRGLEEMRKVELRTGVSENANGSAWAKLGQTEVITGVKVAMGTPYPDSPDKGSISVGVELMPMASPIFESGPPRPEAIELARVVDRGIREGQAIDFKKLCLVEGEQVLIVFIDNYIANHDGNLFDAAGLAAAAALHTARKPKIEDDKIVQGEYTGKLEVDHLPILNTVAKVAGRLVVDPTIGEETAMDARLSIATTEEGNLTAFQKGGQGSFLAHEVDKCVELALKNGKVLRKIVEGK